MEMGYNLYRSLESEGKVLRGSIGVRINSQYGVGAIEATSTAAPTSKFGVPIKDTDYNELLKLFAKWPEVNGLHSHVGSQGIDLSSMVNGVKFILDLADRLNRDLHRKQITILDIGGGLPVGAYGGRRDVMSCVAPIGPVYQAGTLSGNPIAMAAGLATLKTLRDTPNIYRDLNYLRASLGAGLATMFANGMLSRGVLMAPSQFEAMFLSAAHTNDDVEQFLDAAKATIETEGF